MLETEALEDELLDEVVEEIIEEVVEEELVEEESETIPDIDDLSKSIFRAYRAC